MDFFEAVSARHSYRGMYTDQKVPREDLRRLMEAGLAAPSGCNKQTTHLIGVDDPSLIGALGTLIGKPTFASAPAAICVASEPLIAYRDRTFHLQDYAAAIENILLAATAMGYASCWVEGYITDPENGIQQKMAAALNLPPEYILVAYLPIGVPADAMQIAQRKPFDARAWFNRLETKE